MAEDRPYEARVSLWSSLASEQESLAWLGGINGPQWSRQPWNDFCLVCFTGCPMCPHIPGPVGKWSWVSYLCKVVPHCCWEKDKKERGPSLCVSPASEGLGSLSWAKRWGHLYSPAIKPGEESPFPVYLWGRPYSLRLSFPGHQEEATDGGNSFTLQIFIKYLHGQVPKIKQTLSLPTWSLQTSGESRNYNKQMSNCDNDTSCKERDMAVQDPLKGGFDPGREEPPWGNDVLAEG